MPLPHRLDASYGRRVAPPFDDLDRAVAEARLQEAVAARMRAEDHHQLAVAEATAAGVLVDLGERRDRCRMVLVDGTVVVGLIHLVGADVVGLRAPDGNDHLIPLVALAAVSGAPDRPAVVGARPAPEQPTFAEALAWWAEDRPSVVVRLPGDRSSVRGRLRDVGLETAVVVPEGEAAPVVIVLAAALEVVRP